MKQVLFLVVICSVIVSCGILSSPGSGEIEIKLLPQIASIDDPVTLVIKNETNQSIRYHCGHVVERKQNEEWIEHTGTGCANAFPVEIKSGHRYEIDDFLLAPSKPGYYRAIVSVVSDDENFIETRRVSETIEFVENQLE